MMSRIKAYQRRSRWFLAAALAATALTVLVAVPRTPLDAGDRGGELSLALTAIMWFGFLSSTAQYRVASEIQLRLDRIQDELEQKLDDISLFRNVATDADTRSRENEKRLDQLDDQAADESQHAS